ncbi:cytochrome c oxidase subunit IVB [Halobacillus massiliensis]|uniref:cytochrome c oxidase subunit IVB n=1 Tax=Halobacillus massiliensis TaxID=1926286 RepID=UPI0009E5F049|nr:cytochrome c oxidase subunit IVB [Halobacillus massiliensis]
MANHTETSQQVEFERKQHKEEMKQQVVSFAFMIIFTVIAFGMVILEIGSVFLGPTLILLAIVQVLFQFYYFMHMKNKGHGMVSIMIYGGISVGALTIITFVALIWW